ncbi:class I glutamine amidotransferase-like protein [Crepidotus variabilis]|uniref:D-lactate dehydratase n=1 Tax=Crepidotus variabilis TaxID=179855 RepID=A0A9P6JWA3_9AGAR|nr:class I glutamine amidotransferase-like protein [Crepidotus variabilis]
MAPKNILFVLTSADKTFTGLPTGWYLPEAAHPYYSIIPHAHIDFATPKGANPPVDQISVQNFTDEESVKFLKDETVIQKLATAKKLTEVNSKDYDAVFYVGGVGPVVDLAIDPVNAKLASDFWNEGKIVAAVCHGPAALIGAKDTSGKSVFAGRKFTGFSNAEEEKLGFTKDVPFLLEDKIQELGGIFEKAPGLFEPEVVIDGKLFTGQNPASAKPLGQEVAKALA